MTGFGTGSTIRGLSSHAFSAYALPWPESDADQYVNLSPDLLTSLQAPMLRIRQLLYLGRLHFTYFRNPDITVRFAVVALCCQVGRMACP